MVEVPSPARGRAAHGGNNMTNSLKAAEGMVRRLIRGTNRSYGTTTWTYELTSEVDNIEVVSGPESHTLRIHPCWLRYVVAQGEFDYCVADEREAWYLLQRLTADHAVTIVA
jgi:hypothetical protein